MKIFGFEIFGRTDAGSTHDVISVDDIQASTSTEQSFFPPVSSVWDGSKYFGGFGSTELLTMDYWSLRQRSGQLFRQNLYARGLIRRLVTNEINTGLCLEATPDELTLGLEEASLTDWSEDTERRFELWGNSPMVCDYLQENTFAELQKRVRREALIDGDILVVLRQNSNTKMPAIQLVNGNAVRTPFMQEGPKLRKGHTIKEGVELDPKGRKVAFWVRQEDGKFERIAAYGRKSGRRMAWLVYGTDKRSSDVRGEPLLAIILQSLKEIDRYRDSVQRRAVIQSILAMFIAKGEDKPGTKPMTGGAVRKTNATPIDDGAASSNRTLQVADQVPGFIAQELQVGETPHAFKMDGNGPEFATFEAAVIRAIAWANEVPPEILELSFSNNYSASQAAINEFKLYLNPVRQTFGQMLCQPIYVEWLISEALLRKISAPGLLESWRNPMAYETFAAWVASDWSGAIKPSTDILKQAKGYAELVKRSWVTNGRASRELTGTKFEKNVKKVTRENELLVKSMEPLAKFKQEYPESANLIDMAFAAANGIEQGIDVEELAEQAAGLAMDQLLEEQTEEAA